jgi:hypothetical protein
LLSSKRDTSPGATWVLSRSLCHTLISTTASLDKTYHANLVLLEMVRRQVQSLVIRRELGTSLKTLRGRAQGTLHRRISFHYSLSASVVQCSSLRASSFNFNQHLFRHSFFLSFFLPYAAYMSNAGVQMMQVYILLLASAPENYHEVSHDIGDFPTF